MSSAVPQILAHHLPAMLESYLPGITQSYRDATLANTWSQIKEEMGDTELPEFGTAAYAEMCGKLEKANPWLASLDFPQLGALEALQEKARAVCKLARGERYDPKAVAKSIQQAIKTGEEQGKRKYARVQAGRSLGSGRGSSGFGSREEDNPIRIGYEEHLRRSGPFARGGK